MFRIHFCQTNQNGLYSMNLQILNYTSKIRVFGGLRIWVIPSYM